MQSTTQKKNPKMNTVTITTEVVACTSFRVGVTTFSSPRAHRSESG